MKGHLYKFTVEHLEDKAGNAIESSPLLFETRNHEDIFNIVKKVKEKADLNDEDAAAFAVGLKLFGGVMLKNKSNTLFTQLMPNFRNLMKELKG